MPLKAQVVMQLGLKHTLRCVEALHTQRPRRLLAETPRQCLKNKPLRLHAEHSCWRTSADFRTFGGARVNADVYPALTAPGATVRPRGLGT